MEYRLAGGEIRDPYAVPVGRRADAGAERLDECLLRREAFGKVVGAQSMCPEARQLAIDQHLLGEAFAPAIERLLYAMDLHDVGAQAVDHGAAWVISCFISRTA